MATRNSNVVSLAIASLGFLSMTTLIALALAILIATPQRAAASTVASEIFARVAPSVPIIVTPVRHGTGILFDATHVMTDAHVVEDFDSVAVRFPGGATYPTAKVVARDRLVDMAIIELQGSRDVTVSIAPPPTEVGADLYLLGYPDGANTLSPVVSRGIVSQVSDWDDAGMTYVRTDARGEPGVSGGPILDANGNVVGVVQFQSGEGAYMIAASAADLKARAERLLAGENVDGIANLKPSGQSGVAFDVQLRPGMHPEESFLVTSKVAKRAQFSLDASQVASTMSARLASVDGTLLASATLSDSKKSGTITARLAAGTRYWLSVSSDGSAHVSLQSSLAVTRLENAADRPLESGRTAGLLEHSNDINCRQVELQAGQGLTARAESIMFAPTLSISSPGGATIAVGNGGSGVRGTDVQSNVVSASNGDFTVCVGASGPISFAGGYVLSLTTTTPPPTVANAGTFVASATRLAAARAENATVALHDGEVLTIDGLDGRGALLASAERYDAAHDVVTPVRAADKVARRDPTALVLADGRVLVVGGITSDGITDIATVYNPADDSWVTAGKLRVARVGAQAVLLNDGRVLIVGGTGTFLPLASAEIFDPISGQFSTTGAMAIERSAFTATRLADGRVLVAGGLDADLDVNGSAEIFDPNSGRFSATDDLVAARQGHTATLLPSGLVLIAGGADESQEVAGAELYDPTGATFRGTGSLQVAREDHMASTLLDGRVLITSGVYRGLSLQPDVEVGAAELYDPITGQFALLGGLTTPCQQLGAALPDGTVVFMGGATFAGALDAVQSFKPGAVVPESHAR